MTPAGLAKQAIVLLEEAGNPRDAAQARAYFKKYEDVSFFGVKAPTQKEIEKKLYGLVRNDWEVPEAIQFCDILIRHSAHECKNIGIILLSRFHRDFEKSLFRKSESWLSRNYCASWASVDCLSPLILTPLILKYPDLLPRLLRWSDSSNVWLRRASVVTLIPPARKGKLLNRAYGIALKLRNDEHDLIHKATGWLLREAGKTDTGRLLRFLQQNGPKLPRTTIRYSIEKFPKEIQKRLLRETRP